MLSKQAEITTTFQNNNAALQQTISVGRVEFKNLQEGLRTAATGAGSSHPGSSERRAPKTLVDSSDYRFPQMPDSCSALHFSKGRHDGLNNLEAHDCWRHDLSPQDPPADGRDH